MAWINGLLKNSNARKEQFISLFRQHARLAPKGAEILTATFDGRTELKNGLVRIESIEHEGDVIVRATHELLDRTFIPPFDRDHVATLCKQLDDILDGMNTTLRAVEWYGIGRNELRHEAGDFCKIISQGATELVELFDAFPRITRSEFSNKLLTINKLEDDADDLLGVVLNDIFYKRGADRAVTVEMLAWREIFGHLEEVTDHCNHAVQVLNSIARWEGI